MRDEHMNFSEWRKRKKAEPVDEEAEEYGEAAPAPKPPSIEEAKALFASVKPKLAQYSGVDDLREAHERDETSKGAGRVSDALYSAFSRSPLQFRNRGGGEVEQVQAEQKAELKDPAHDRNVIYRQHLKTAYPEIFSHYPTDIFERITRDDDDAFDLAKLRAKTPDPLLPQRKALLEAKTKQALRPPQQKGSPYIVVTGKDGAQYFANPRNPKEEAVPVEGPGGEQIQKPQKVDDPRKLDAVGWSRRPDAPHIKPEEAAGFRTATETQATAQSNIDQMRGLIQQHGSEMTGPVAATMGALATDMLLQVKTLAQLGVLSKSDEALINRLVPDPSSPGAALKSTESMLAGLAQFEKSLKQKLEARATALGYVRGNASANGLDLSKLSPEERAEYEALQNELGDE